MPLRDASSPTQGRCFVTLLKIWSLYPLIKNKDETAALLTAQWVDCWLQWRARCQVLSWDLQNSGWSQGWSLGKQTEMSAASPPGRFSEANIMKYLSFLFRWKKATFHKPLSVWGIRTFNSLPTELQMDHEWFHFRFRKLKELLVMVVMIGPAWVTFIVIFYLKFGTHVYSDWTKIKVCVTNSINATGSQPFWI